MTGLSGAKDFAYPGRVERVRVCVLGRGRLTTSDGDVKIRSELRRRLLARLVLEEGETVGFDALTEAMWGLTPPRTARESTHVHVSELRRHFREIEPRFADVIVTDPQGYRIDLSQIEVDSVLFEAAVATGRRLLIAGDTDAALDRLEAALADWGEPFADLIDVPGATPVRARLLELRDQAAGDHIEALLALGRHDDVVARLRAVVADQPLDERPYRQLAIALYRADRQADALAVIGEGRSVLLEELGIDPSATYAELELQILQQDPALQAVDAGSPTAPLVSLPNVAASGSPFVGRAELVDAVTVMADDRASAGIGLVALHGEAGSGKSRMVVELADGMAKEDWITLYGRCEVPQRAPFQPFAESIGRLFAEVDAATRRDLLGPSAGELRRIVPRLASLVPDLAEPVQAAAEVQRFQLFEAIVDLFARLGQLRPTAVFLEDMHWADTATIALVRHLVLSPGIEGVVLIGTHRDDEGTIEPGWNSALADLERSGEAARVAIEPFGEPEVAAYLREVLAQDELRPATLAGALVDRTGGNAFFLTALIDQLVAADSLDVVGGEVVLRDDTATNAVPESARALILARLAALTEAERSVVEGASVVGGEIDAEVVAGTLEADIAEVANTLDRAADRRLVRAVDNGRFEFTHDLVRSAIYESLAAGRRATLHLSAATAIGKVLGGERRDAEIASHLLRAVPVASVESAVQAVGRAAERAVDATAFGEAVELYRDALDVIPPEAQRMRGEILARLGWCERVAAVPGWNVRLAEAADLAREQLDVGLLWDVARSWRASGWVGELPGSDAEYIELLDEVLERLGPVESRARAEALAARASAVVYSPGHHGSTEVFTEALEMARRIDDPDTLMWVMSNAMALDDRERVAERGEIADELVRRSAERGDPTLEALGQRMGMIVDFEIGNIESISVRIAEQERLAGVIVQPVYPWGVMAWKASIAVLQGRLAEAEELAAAALEFGVASPAVPSTRPPAMYGGVMFEVRRLQGRMGELVPVLEQMVIDQPEMVMWPWALALAQAESGQADAAIDFARGFIGERAPFRFGLQWSAESVAAATVVVEAGAQDLARQLIDDLGHLADRMASSASSSHGPLAHSLGRCAELIDDLDRAQHFYDAAGSVARRVESPLYEAEAEAGLARVAERRDDPLTARAHAERALDLIGDVGPTRVEPGLRSLIERLDGA